MDHDVNIRGDWMPTYTGRQFWPLKPRSEDVDIIDIAHALSNLCRYGGHTTVLYTVAHHSVLVSQIVPAKDALWGLLHDAAEAYVMDLIRPIKHDPGAEWYRAAEARVMRAVCERFSLPFDQPESVTEADIVLVATERRDLLTPTPGRWQAPLDGVSPMPAPIFPWAPPRAEVEFLKRAAELGVPGVALPRLGWRAEHGRTIDDETGG